MNRKSRKPRGNAGILRRAAAIGLSLALVLSCRMSNAGEAQKQFKDDSYFFMGLQAADAGDEEKAMRLLKSARDSGSATELVARRSAESLTLLGNVTERNEAARILAERFADDQARLTAGRELYRQDEISALIAMTDGIDYATAPNELARLRLDALLERGDGRLEHEFFEWAVSRPLSSEHVEFNKKFLAGKITTLQRQQELALTLYESELKSRQDEWRGRWRVEHPDETLDESLVPTKFEGLEPQTAEIPVTEEQSLIEFRVLLHHRDYHEAFRKSAKILEIYEARAVPSEPVPPNEGEPPPPSPVVPDSRLSIDEQILSDIGKAHLYGTDSYGRSARLLKSLARRLPPPQAFYAHFYAARLLDKTRSDAESEAQFRAALDSADSVQKFDNALWYFLSSRLRSGADKIVPILSEFGGRIGDREYFDDFFQTLSLQLLTSSKWDDFLHVWRGGSGAMSDETAGKFAYISGRLIEEGLSKEADNPGERAREAFTAALAGAGSVYYKACALARLNNTDAALADRTLRNAAPADGGIPPDEAKSEVPKSGGAKAGETAADGTESEISAADGADGQEARKSGADKLLAGYATFGFPARVYPEWLLNRADVSMDATISASQFLNNCGRHDPSYNVQSLRIADRTRNSARGELPRPLLELCYPRFFPELVSKACAENEMDEKLLYALVRTESFFEPDVSSSAGANGLTQLMDSTAADEARKLKLGEGWDVLDPETNLRMGSHYLSSLISRVDGNTPILALFAYNGGLTNVRNWLKKSVRAWEKARRKSVSPAGMPLDLFLETLPFKETRGYGRHLVGASAMYGWLYYGDAPESTVRRMFGWPEPEKTEEPKPSEEQKP